MDSTDCRQVHDPGALDRLHRRVQLFCLRRAAPSLSRAWYRRYEMDLICERCREPLGESDVFCTKCGMRGNATSRPALLDHFCQKCGAPLAETKFCTKCGAPVEHSPVKPIAASSVGRDKQPSALREEPFDHSR